MKIIDAHNHPDWHGHGFGKFLEDMELHGISRTWLMTWECPENEYDFIYKSVLAGPALGATTGPIPLSLCLAYKEKRPEKFVLGFCPDPRLPDACARLRAAHGIYGAKVCGELKCRMMYDSPDAIRLFNVAGERGMPVTFHLQYDSQKSDRDPRAEWWGGTIDTVERILQACPGTVFLGHAPGFWAHISNDELWRQCIYPPQECKVIPGGRLPELLRKYPNLYCDISAESGRLALSRDPDFARLFLAEFQDRVLFARDCFGSQHRELMESLNLPAETLEKIYHGNAEKMIMD